MEGNPNKTLVAADDPGARRLSRLQHVHRSTFNKPLSGRILDFGCGAGRMLAAGIAMGRDIYGIEVEPERLAQYRHFVKRLPKEDQDKYLSRFQLYDGVDLPYPARDFDAVTSYFVFEHVPDTFGSLRQIARVLRPGGTVMLFAEEARNGWEGHPQIPWPPFMPRRYTRAYLEEFDAADREDFINKSCFYVTGPMIASALEAFGFEIVALNTPPPPPFPETMYIMSDEDAREAARIAKVRLADGAWTTPKQNLEVFAIKRAA